MRVRESGRQRDKRQLKNECRWKIKKRGIREKKENKNDKDREEIKE